MPFHFYPCAGDSVWLSTNKKVESIHFVYDFNIKKNTFTYNSLRSLFDLPKKIFISPETQIDVVDDNILYHPVFGKTKNLVGPE